MAKYVQLVVMGFDAKTEMIKEVSLLDIRFKEGEPISADETDAVERRAERFLTDGCGTVQVTLGKGLSITRSDSKGIADWVARSI